MTFQAAPYRQSCENTINQYIRDATRLEAFTFAIDPLDIFELNYEVALDIQISSRIDNDIRLGALQSSEEHPVYRVVSDYENTLQTIIVEEIAKPRNFTRVKETVRNHSFGHLHQTCDLYRSQKTVSHCYHCPQCTAKGTIRCPECSGSGKTTCSSCSGAGYTTYTSNIQTSQGPRLQTNKRSCSSCWGSGKRNCGNCGGSCRVTCPSCKGHKYFTKISTVVTTAEPSYMPVYNGEDTPSYITEALYHYGMHQVDQLGSVTFLSEKETNEHALQFVYKAQCPFGKYKSIIKEKEIFWILYGKDPIIFESSNVVETLLIEDLVALEHSARSVNLLKPYIAQACKKSVRNFTESEVNQALIKLSVDTSNLEKTRDDLQRSVSVNYLEVTHKAFSKLTTAIKTWSLIKWILFVFAFLIAYAGSITLTELSPNEMSALSQDGLHWLPTFYHDLYKANGVLPFGTSIAKAWNYMLYPILALSLIPYLLRIFWLKFWLKRQLPYLYEWMVNQKRCPHKWISLSVITLLSSAFIINFAQIPIYNGSLLGILPIDLALSGIEKIKTFLMSF